jgi:hypothetical protein
MISSEDGTRFAIYRQVASSKTKDEIKAYLLEGNSITSSIALSKFGCDHLRVVVRDLQNEGIRISYKLEDDNNGGRIRVYTLNK